MLAAFPWYGFAFLSMLLLVIKSIFEKRFLTNHEETGYVFVFYLINVLIVLPLLYFVSFDLTLGMVGLLLLNGAISALAMDLFVVATKHMDLSCVFTFRSSGTILTVLFGWLWLGEALTAMQTLGLFVVLVATFLFLHEEALLLHQKLRTMLHNRYFFYLLLAMLLSVATALLDRDIMRTLDTMSYLVLSRFTMLFFAAAIFARRGHFVALSKQIPSLVKRDFMKVFPLALGTVLIAFTYFQALSFEGGKVGLVVAIRNLSIVVISLYGGWMLKEKGVLAKTVISGLVVVGLVVLRG